MHNSGIPCYENYGVSCLGCFAGSYKDTIYYTFHLCILYVDFLGGVAYQETSSGSGPYFLGEVNCKGSESHLFNCSIGVEECDSQYSLGSAGVLCYRQQSRSILIPVSF